MDTGLKKGDFAQVTGTFDLADKSGTIDYVTPVHLATLSSDLTDEGIHLIGKDKNKTILFDVVVNPQRNSCAPHAQQGTFEEFVPTSPQLNSIQLIIRGVPAAEFNRGQKTALGAMSFGAADPRSPNRVPLNVPAGTSAVPGVTYTVQARADEAAPWQTLALGLPTPFTSVDVNQFPGAKSVSVRVLQSDGFSETKVFDDVKKF